MSIRARIRKAVAALDPMPLKIWDPLGEPARFEFYSYNEAHAFVMGLNLGVARLTFKETDAVITEGHRGWWKYPSWIVSVKLER